MTRSLTLRTAPPLFTLLLLGVGCPSGDVDPLVPDVFTGGSIAALISIGNSGFPHPCVAQPTSTCSSSIAAVFSVPSVTPSLPFSARVINAVDEMLDVLVNRLGLVGR